MIKETLKKALDKDIENINNKLLNPDLSEEEREQLIKTKLKLERIRKSL